MQITELSSDTRVWQAVCDAQRVQTRGREPGLHLSTIVNDIAATVYPKEFWYLKRDKRDSDAPEEFDERTRATFEAGQVVEDMIAATFAARLGWHKPKPQCSAEGIWCSPDGLSPAGRTLDEMKATWKSSRDFVHSPKWQLYEWQVMGYMHVFRCRRVRLHVMHMNGDWRPPRPMPPKTYVLTASDTEVAANWAMCTTHAKDMGWLRKR